MRHGDLQRAAEALRRSLAAEPDQPAALINLGAVLRALGQPQEALQCYERALALRADLPEGLSNRANVLADLGRYSEALQSCDRALALRPEYPEALNNRGNVLRSLGRLTDALSSFERALEMRPAFPAALNGRALTLIDSGRIAEALSDCEQALRLEERAAEAHNIRGIALQRLGRTDEALASFNRALQLQPAYAQAHANRGSALLELGRSDEALVSHGRALQLTPFDAAVRYSYASALRILGRFAEALESLALALDLKPDFLAALNDRASLLAQLGRYEEAVEAFSRVTRQDPHVPLALGHLLHCRMHLCDWADHAARAAELQDLVAQGFPAVAPLWLLALTDSAALQLACARRFAAHQTPPGAAPLPRVPVRHSDKLRIAYLSSDFRNHVVARLMAGVIERHDRQQFTVTGVSLSMREASPLGRRAADAFDRFEEVAGLTDGQIAGLIRDRDIDILVDLNGWTQGMRPGLLARRPAPVQVSYLGYPGTTGADYIDYLLADAYVVPGPALRHYSEKVVYLPGGFQANDDGRAAATGRPSRSEAGLSETALILGCFNNPAKLTPVVFDVWARFLHACERCLLWLVAEGGAARHNLQSEAERRGIDPARLLFMPRLSYGEHIARLPLADLALDTFPFNGGATTSDVLRAGVPVLTCAGEAFAARMGGTLLSALDLPELIAHDLEDYERLGLALLREPARLAGARCKLARQLPTGSVFDTERIRRALESAYLDMFRQLRGRDSHMRTLGDD